MRFFATTFSGLEDIAAAELSSLLSGEAEADVGKVLFTASLEECVKVNYAAQTVNRVFLLLLREHAETLTDVERLCASVDYRDFIGREQSFAVKAERVGVHGFTSLDIAATVGKAVIDSYKAETGVRLRVDLNNPDVEVYAILRNSELLLGLNTTGESLHRRFYRRGFHRAALSPAVANTLVRFSGWRRNMVLLDPFTGSGTIPLETALYGLRISPGARRQHLSLEKIPVFRGIDTDRIREELMEAEDPGTVEVIGIDISPKSLKLAFDSLEALGREKGVRFVQGDVFRLVEHVDREVDKVVCNPPFGVRLRLREPEKFYTEAFAAIAQACPNASLTVIVNKPVTVLRALEKSGYTPLCFRKVLLGDLSSYVFHSERV
ncbi:MAG: THUMP domain-containing protein [Candidatus Caldarchaeum sp.]|jgi:tRNA (guanine6-N2)-methyltransferase